MKRKWFYTLLPLLLGLMSILLLVRTRMIEFVISLPADLDVIALLTGAAVSALAAITLGLREGMERMRQVSVKRARAEALSEHHRFLQRLDHELKNPLTALRAGLVNLGETLENEDQRAILASMEVQVRRISRLIADLRKLAELETLPLEISVIDVAHLLEELLTLVQERPEAQERRLILNLPKAPHVLPPISGDQDLLLLALHNLVDNALKYTRPGDTIELQVSVKDEMVVIQVIDTGQGIPEAELSLVWEELYRGQSVDSVPGSGIGLALALAIVERHGGQIGLQSRLGQGTTVTVQLPVA
jgi:two-component system OmpR family sensor kinase